MNHTIRIDQAIDSSVAAQVCTWLEAKARETDQDLYIKISSYGGCIGSMLAITDTMAAIPNDVVTIAYGKVMSAGSFIAVHGTPGKRYAYYNTSYMFHEPNGFAELDKKGIEHMVYVKELTTKLLAERSGLSISEMEDICDRDWYMMASELIDHPGSFVDKII